MTGRISSEKLFRQVKARLKDLTEPGAGLTAEKVDGLLRLISIYNAETKAHALQAEASASENAKTSDQYRTLFDFTPAGYIVLDREGIVQDINLTACVMLGVDRKQAAKLRGLPQC